MGGRSYQPKDSDIAIGENLFGVMQECMELKFFEDKAQINKCFYEVTPDEALSIKGVMKGPAILQADLQAALTQLATDATSGDTDAQATLAALAAATIDTVTEVQ